MNIIKSLYIFQKERFPLKILIFTTLSSVLASAAVVPNDVSVYQMSAAFFISLFFLFHIRVIDESRDYKIDSGLHPNRPVQRGVISIQELFLISLSGLIISCVLAYMTNSVALIFLFAFIAFTALAWRDFFVPSFFTRRPFLYHILNSPQMILIQWVIFILYTGTFKVQYLMVLQLLLVYNNIFILEVVRKVKVPAQDTSDTYSAHLGISKTIIFLIIMTLLGYVLFAFILYGIGTAPLIFNVLGALITIITLFVFLYFVRCTSLKNQKLMVLTSVLFYVISNLLIYMTK